MRCMEESETWMEARGSRIKTRKLKMDEMGFQ